MVATRRGAQSAPDAVPAPSNTLNAPPKRGGKKKAAIDEGVEPAPPAPKPIKTTAARRKVKAEPEADMPALPSKTTAPAKKTTRATKSDTTTESAPKRATRCRKAQETATVDEAAIVVEEAVKPATTRTRKAPAKKTVAAVEEHPAVEISTKDAAKPVTRARKAPTKKVAAPKQVHAPIVEEHVLGTSDPTKPISGMRKASASKAVAPLPTVAPRTTRGRNVAAPPQDSPLKAPARKPTKKATADASAIDTPAVAPTPEQIEEPFIEFPTIPSTPAPFAQNFTARRAMKELAQYPTTPAHILAPITNKAVIEELPGYPKTPAHIKAPITTMAALEELPSYPSTPAHIKIPSPEEIENPTSLMASIQSESVEDMDINGENRMDIDTEDKRDADQEEIISTNNETAMRELPDYPSTPGHIKAPITNSNALKELPDYPETPAHIQAPTVSLELPAKLDEAPRESPNVASSPSTTSAHDLRDTTSNHVISTPQNIKVEALATTMSPISKLEAHDVATPPAAPTTPGDASSPISEAYFESGTPRMPANIIWGGTNQEAFEELPVGYPATPAHITAPVSTREALAELPGYPKTPAHITAPVSTKDALAELPGYPKTPAHITAPVSTKDALAELPGYPKTPAHITAPVTPRRALAELPSYPTTPSMAMEAAIQEEICASVKKQTPSPSAKMQSSLDISELDEVSFSFANSEQSEVMHSESEVSEAATRKIAPAPLQVAAPQLIAPPKLSAAFSAPALVSPIKSALRSPQKNDTKTPKKAVTWDDPDESGLSPIYGRPLQGMTFFVEVMRDGRDQSYLFSSLLVDLGAKVVREWENTGITHVLYKDGNKSTLEKVIASKGAVKCLNVGWVIDCEEKRARLDENNYLVDLSIAMPASPKPTSPQFAKMQRTFTPMRTPAKQAVPLAIPTTPTSSEFDRSIVIEDKENCEPGIFFDSFDANAPRTVPHKKSTFLFSRSPIRTPSQPRFLMNSPIKPQSAIKPFATVGKKRSLDHSFPGITMAPPKKLRLV